MGDFLNKILHLIADAKTAADADLPFLLQLEQQVVGKLRDPIAQMQQQGIMPQDPSQVPAGADPSQMPPGMQSGMPPPGPPPQMQPQMQRGGLSTGPNPSAIGQRIQQMLANQEGDRILNHHG